MKEKGLMETALANVLIHKANELKRQTRAAVEAEMGRLLEDDEAVSIMAFSMHEAPSGDARRKAAQKLESHLQRTEKRTGKMNEKQTEAALQEALKHARPGYRERE